MCTYMRSVAQISSGRFAPSPHPPWSASSFFSKDKPSSRPSKSGTPSTDSGTRPPRPPSARPVRGDESRDVLRRRLRTACFSSSVASYACTGLTGSGGIVFALRDSLPPPVVTRRRHAQLPQRPPHRPAATTLRLPDHGPAPDPATPRGNCPWSSNPRAPFLGPGSPP